MLPKQNVVKALTERNIRERPSFTITNATLTEIDGGYKAVCGTTAPITAHNSVTPTGSDLVDIFMGQIGCPGDDPRTWESRQAHYRAQFDKARQCFRGRVDAMKAYNANTPEEKEARASHAFAAQAAYTIGRDCLRKISDVIGAEDAYRASAKAHIDEASIVKPNIKEALTDAGDGTLDAVIRANPYLGPLYAKDYGMSQEQWAIYHSFLRFSTLKASNYANTDGLRAKAMRAYQAMINPASVGGGGAATGGAATGGAGTGLAAIPVTPVVNVNPVNTILAKKAGGLTLGGIFAKKKVINAATENALLAKEAAEVAAAGVKSPVINAIPTHKIPVIAYDNQRMIVTSLTDFPLTITKDVFDTITENVDILYFIPEAATTYTEAKFISRYIIPYFILSAAIDFSLAKIKFLKILIRAKNEQRKARVLKNKDDTESVKTATAIAFILGKLIPIEKYMTELKQLLVNLVGHIIIKIPDGKISLIKLIKDFQIKIERYNNSMTGYLFETQKEHIETIGWKQLYPFAAELLDTSDTDESGLLGDLVRLYREVRALP